VPQALSPALTSFLSASQQQRANLILPVNAVEFETVSKTYCLYDSPADRLRELASFNRRTKHREFRALHNLTFTIPRGEVFCIVGENGSGKSTTLKLMAGIAQPTSGEVRVAGRVAALLELGSGFNPEFSGRENVYLNASILGLSHREIDARYKAIEAFAEIGDFIDQPVKTYSSGMAVRLAFAVAISVDPEVLIVDEALAVGDTYFRHRCMRKVQELRSRGVTIVFVSHSIADVKAIGERVLWLRHGEMVAIGEPDLVIAQYLAAMVDKPATAPRPTLGAVDSIPNIDSRHGTGAALITGIAVTDEFGDPLHLMTPNSSIVVRIALRAAVPLHRPQIGFVLRNHLGLDFAEIHHTLDTLSAGDIVTVSLQLEIPELYPGAFSFSPFLKERPESDNEICDWIDNAVTVQMARSDKPVYGYLQWPCRVELNSKLAQITEGVPQIA
jgi:ABC-type polysaccharide/polyol phosphate transport system ATPase subunit